MDQQEDRPGFEQDMEHSAAVEYVGVNILIHSSFSQCKLTYTIHIYMYMYLHNMDTCSNHMYFKE